MNSKMYSKQHTHTHINTHEHSDVGFLPGLGSVTELVVEAATVCRTGAAQGRKCPQNDQTATHAQKQKERHAGTDG